MSGLAEMIAAQVRRRRKRTIYLVRRTTSLWGKIIDYKIEQDNDLSFENVAFLLVELFKTLLEHIHILTL